MKRIIDVKFLREIINDLKQQEAEMKNIESKIKKDIASINDVYKGSDATLIVTKYTEQINEISKILKTLDSYINYFEVVIDKYGTNISVALQKLQKVSN